MHVASRIYHMIQQRWWYLSFVLLIIICVGFFTYIQAIPAVPDPDSFYHVQMSLEIPERGIITEFPWLQVSVLKDSYINQHFLYHLFLIPFTHAMDPMQGAKLAQVFLNTGFIILMYALFRRLRTPGAFGLALLLLVTTPFMFRLNLIKAPVVSLLFLFGGIYCLFQKKYIPLFLLSFAYVWAYGGFLLLALASGLYAAVSGFMAGVTSSRHQPWSATLRSNKEIRMFFIVLGGTVAGIFINPQFPENLLFYWRQLVAIGIINYQDIINVGNEWYPYAPLDLFSESLILTIGIISVLAIIVLAWRRPSAKVLFSGLWYVFFLLLTLKSRRYVEYYVPAGVLFIAVTIAHYTRYVTWPQVRQCIHSALTPRYIALSAIIVAYCVVAMPYVITKDVQRLNQDYENGIALDRFAGAGNWLHHNAQPGDIVFHSSWDEFPILFYRSPDTYYIAGLDPTFSYEYDRDLWQLIVDITTGAEKDSDAVYTALRDTFDATYVFIERGHTGMHGPIQRSNGFIRVYEDDEAYIYQVLPEKA